jgi:thiamine biosynthesis lipoprotein
MKGSTEYISEGKIFHASIPHVMGTRLEMLAVGTSEDVIAPLWNRLHDLVFRLDMILNRFDPSSEVSVLNMSDNPLELEMSEPLKEMVELSDRYYDMTGGFFDVVDSDGKLDFGGFAKGYFLKKCNELLRRKGVECAFVDFGGSSILGIGRHPYGDSWKVGVVNPYTRLQLREISLVDGAMSTSGNTPSYSGHIRNPHTGESCAQRKLVTVVGADPLDAEVLSTVLMIASENESSKILSGFPDVKTEIICL